MVFEVEEFTLETIVTPGIYANICLSHIEAA